MELDSEGAHDCRMDGLCLGRCRPEIPAVVDGGDLELRATWLIFPNGSESTSRNDGPAVWSSAWIAFAAGDGAIQSDTLRVDSVVPVPALRVRSFAEASLVDSLWSDSCGSGTDRATAPCVHFDLNFPTARIVGWISLCAGSNATDRPQCPDSRCRRRYSTASVDWQASIARIDLEAMGRKLVATSCFPASSAEFAQLLAAMEGAVFESENALSSVRQAQGCA